MKPNAGKPAPALSGVTGTARVGRATSGVLPLLQAGDIAVIDQADLDRDAATALVDAGVAAVVNAASMVAGRYANLGPEGLAGAGVVVVDQVGQAALDRIEDDQCIRVHDGVVYAVGPDGQNDVIAHGRPVAPDRVPSRGLPQLTPELAGRAVVVVGAPEHRELQAVAPFV